MTRTITRTLTSRMPKQGGDLTRAGRLFIGGAVLAALLLPPARAGADDAVLQWNAIMVSTTSALNPFAQARIAAITQLAVFEAVNAIEGGYAPYLDSRSAPEGASADAAAVAAAHHVLRAFFPANAAALEAVRLTSLAAIADGPAKDSGVAVGEAAAAAMIALRAGDGSAPAAFHVPSSSEPGVWQTTTGCPPAGGVLLHWRGLTPFALRSGSQFRLDAPPPLTSAKYARDYNEVKAVGGAASVARPADRADVARFYAAVSAVTAWNHAAAQVSVALGRSLAQNARDLALLNIAISDGLVASMDTKYHYAFWRPETAIRAAGADGNPDTAPGAAFVPFVTTPCFPGYPSAHASASYAARTVLERLYGSGQHAILLSSPAVPGVYLDYGSFEEMTADIDDARVYGGIHFRFDQEAGALQGGQVGRFVMTHVLAPARGRKW